MCVCCKGQNDRDVLDDVIEVVSLYLCSSPVPVGRTQFLTQCDYFIFVLQGFTSRRRERGEPPYVLLPGQALDGGAGTVPDPNGA